MPDILVYVETLDGAATDGALQCLAKARQLADESRASLVAVAVGADLGALPAEIIARGADVVLVADDPRVRDYLGGPYRKVLSEVVARRGFATVILPSSTQGNDLAPGLAVRMSAACVLDAQQLELRGGAFVASRPELDRKVMVSYAAATAERPLVVTLRDGAAEAGRPDPARKGDVVKLAVELGPTEGRSRVVRRDVVKKTVNLREAKTIVVAGAGVGGKKNLALVAELAAALGGEVGATRAAVDAGWLTAERQIGQTGATVRPRLYVACGVSGAVQHRVGMSDSRTIVAINTDAAAPIFKVAHYRVLGDLETVIPKLLALLR